MILLSELVGAMAFLSSCGGSDLMAGQMEKDIFAAHNYSFDIMRIRTDVAYGRSRPHISVLLRFEASDPRDKIYAMLGVLLLSDCRPNPGRCYNQTITNRYILSIVTRQLHLWQPTAISPSVLWPGGIPE
jgi:hypothetical protein